MKPKLLLMTMVAVAMVFAGCDKKTDDDDNNNTEQPGNGDNNGKTATSGITGACTWTLTGTAPNYTLTISGNGAMGNYDYYNIIPVPAPWSSYHSDITTLVMQQGVTTIGKHAFAGCESLTGVTIPNSVTTIGEDAFAVCTGLTSVTIGSSVTTISESAFLACYGLTSVIIPNPVTTIGNYAFENCRALTSVTIPNSAITIGEGAFMSCTSLTEVTNLRTTPQNIERSVFSRVNIDVCTLRVPSSAVNAYQNAEVWQEFVNIVAFN